MTVHDYFCKDYEGLVFQKVAYMYTGKKNHFIQKEQHNCIEL